MAWVYLGLGSNLGDGAENIGKAIELLNGQAGRVEAVSSLIESEPWGFASEHRFTNAVCAIHTSLDAWSLLDVTQAIERQMGRTLKHKPGESYTDRIIDIDILIYGIDPQDAPTEERVGKTGLRMKTERLTLPHPLIFEREFVAKPLQECYERLVEKLLSK